jgi:endonuclease G
MRFKCFIFILISIIIILVCILIIYQTRPPTKKPSSIIADRINLLYGITSKQGTILNKKFFLINHNNQWKIPYWVAYELDTLDLMGTTERQGQFKPDPQLPIGSRAELSDYEKSGYDRGHMAPAADFKRSKEAMTSTFLLSNMSPQTPELNRKIWEKLEDEVREKVETDGKAWIIAGNIFMSADSHFVMSSEFIGPDKVAVPTHCFKAILACKQESIFTMYAFMLPNQKGLIPGHPINYILTIDRLEQITGYDFFPLLADSLENRLENIKPNNWQK